MTSVTMREEGGGRGERHQRDRGGKSQGLKCRMLRWEAVWEKEDAEACFMGGLHSSFFSIYIPYFGFPSHLDHSRALSRVLCAMQ